MHDGFSGIRDSEHRTIQAEQSVGFPEEAFGFAQGGQHIAPG